MVLLLPSSFATLTEDELSILRTNGITVTIHTENNTITLSHHGVPDHGFEGGWGNNPNQPSAQDYEFNIPRTASVAQEKGCVRLGPIGLSISGAPFFNPYTAFGKNAVEGSCQETFDECSGHPTGQGAYHYHKLPVCLYTGDIRNKFLGVAFDGYPIYGPMDETGKNWTSRELDKCHGHTHNGRYIYRISHDFPYILGCYHGDVIRRARPPPRMRRHLADEDKTIPQEYGYRYIRQVFDPNNPCIQTEFDTWKMETCYAFCETPSSDFDDCQPPSETEYTTGTSMGTRSTDNPATGTAKQSTSTGTSKSSDSVLSTQRPVDMSTVSGAGRLHVAIYLVLLLECLVLITLAFV